MQTATIDQIHAHASVRNYRPDPVPTALVETIVAAGQRSSTSSNLQVYSVVAVIDAERKNRLAELCGNQAFISQAPVFLAWCADFGRLKRAGRRRGYNVAADHVESFLVAAVDTALAMQNSALAAESLGLGMCYIGGIRNEPAAIIELMELPDLVFPISGMTLGWPAFEHKVRPRVPLPVVLHWEQYDAAGEAEAMARYDRAMIETGIYSGRQVPIPGTQEEIEDYGWQEHSARRASQPTRTHLRDELRKQGYRLE